MKTKGKQTKIAIILGTRPEIIKMSPIIRELIKKKIAFFIVHTNQHYDKNLDKLFFEELELPKPKYNLGIGSGNHGETIGKMIIELEKILIIEKPNIVLIEGDTNTVLAGSLASSKLRIKLGHIEAGLRSYDQEMPEETNRILCDHCSDYFFAPTKQAKKNLIKEGLPRKKIFITGNTIADAVFQNIKLANKKSKILDGLKLKNKKFFLATVHRQENADRKERLRKIIKGMQKISNSFKFPIILPLHPRTKKMINKFKIDTKDISIIEPRGYLDFLKLEVGALGIITDSGGIQEEACILKVPCITVRDNTERPETIKIGCNLLVGANSQKILKGMQTMLNKRISWKNPYGKGTAGKIIINSISNSNL